MSQQACHEILDYFGGIASTYDINKELRRRGYLRDAGKPLNAMHAKGEVDVIESCLTQVGGRTRIWVKY